jgi:hypothetical protein
MITSSPVWGRINVRWLKVKQFVYYNKSYVGLLHEIDTTAYLGARL